MKLRTGIDADDTVAPSPRPSLGGHTIEVLAELLALTPGGLRELRADSVV